MGMILTKADATIAMDVTAKRDRPGLIRNLLYR